MSKLRASATVDAIRIWGKPIFTHSWDDVNPFNQITKSFLSIVNLTFLWDGVLLYYMMTNLCKESTSVICTIKELHFVV